MTATVLPTLTYAEAEKIPLDLSAAAVFDRLKERLPAPSDSQLAVVLGICRPGMSKRRYRNSIPYAAIVRACIRHGVDLDWILTGRWSCLEKREVEA